MDGTDEKSGDILFDLNEETFSVTSKETWELMNAAAWTTAWSSSHYSEGVPVWSSKN